MYRANHIKKLRETQRAAEAAQREEQRLAKEAMRLDAEDEDDFIDVAPSLEPHPDDPKVATTPFQATRLLRAFDVFPERGAPVNFWTRLNVDLTREAVRGTCHLPHGLKTDIKVLAFCQDHEMQEMLEAGADIAGISDPIRRINSGWLGFDRCIATPAIMPQVMKVAKILGPRKMMPNPKSGTVVQNLPAAIKEAKGGTLLEYRAEGEGEVRVTIGDATSFSDAQILDNMKFLVQVLLRARPRGGASAKSADTPMIAVPGGVGQARDSTKDVYFLDATLQIGTGPAVHVDNEAILPTSVGYFR
eukprot:TRINITY_DN18643_c0_g1_i2.p1 TRINITY_DN18643_c0_g1~~TRINITY_DN18643_c0_g1_i2.p1  ORF type:complete len:303 (+),score=56.11 TRINITY_DN18643_c0_g1_i2:323-1231(+)